MNNSATNATTLKRTDYCGALRAADDGREVVLCGWVHKTRDMGHLVFVDLRDREGLAQVVFQSDRPELVEEAKKLRGEFVVGVRGRVRRRSAVNKDIATGEVEVEALELRVFAASKVPPFVVADPPQASEELRLKYRYLDLRRPKMQRHIRLRHEAALAARNYLSRHGYLEIETPILANPTPEGARDFLVPSRICKGRFYALPQSPQQFKQTLMVAGCDRYFQIVRCFRDEALRADRQLEFTQIDIETSFIDRDDFFALNEGLMEALFALIGRKVERPFRRLPYVEAMEKYGSDKPDLRVPLEMRDLTAAGRDGSSEILKNVVAAGGEVKGLLIPGAGSLSRGQLDKLGEKAKALGAKGLIWIKKQDGWKSSLKTAEADYEKIWATLGGADADLALARRRQEGSRPSRPWARSAGPGPSRTRPAATAWSSAGSPTSRSSSGARKRSASSPCITPSPRRSTRTCPSSKRTRTKCGPRPTTSSSTAPRSAAARSGSTTWTSSAASSRRWA